MDEEKVMTQNELNNSMCCDMPASPASQAAMQLRLMMDKVEGEDKCALCKAAEELEKASFNQTTSWGSQWSTLLLLLMFSGFGDNKSIDTDALTAYMDVIKKKVQKEDCKLQNES